MILPQRGKAANAPWLTACCAVAFPREAGKGTGWGQNTTSGPRRSGVIGLHGGPGQTHERQKVILFSML